MPTGISNGANSVRAMVSHAHTKMAPMIGESTSTASVVVSCDIAHHVRNDEAHEADEPREAHRRACQQRRKRKQSESRAIHVQAQRMRPLIAE